MFCPVSDPGFTCDEDVMRYLLPSMLPPASASAGAIAPSAMIVRFIV